MASIKKGFYVGYSEAQNNGDCFDSGKEGMFPYDSSALSAGTESGNIIGWKMTPEKLFVLLDFTNITFVEKIVLETCSLSEEERKVWGAALADVSYSGEKGSRYFTVGKVYPNHNGGSYEVLINKKIRLLKLEIKRSPWRAYPMPKVTVYGEEPSIAGIPLTKEEMQKEFLYESVCVDEYGQALFADWEGKIRSDRQMKENAAREFKKYENQTADDRYDKYGGIKGFRNLEATGFFRVEKVDGIWWFVTPEGNPYIMKGVDLVCYSEMSYHTPIYIKGTKEVRGVFEKMPDKGKDACAYETNPFGIPVLNYLRMNLHRKYGEDYDAKWVDITEKRLADWGFNAASKWEKHPDIKMPYIHSLNATGPFKKVKWLIDPYAEDFAKNVENSVKDILPSLKDDSYLIGYHYTNESGFDNEIFYSMLVADETCDMKKAFIEFLGEQYTLEQINQRMNTRAKEWSELLTIELPKAAFSQELIDAFIIKTAKVYYKTIRDVLKKYDSNHLYMGAGLTPEWRSSYEWNIGGLEYLDILSFDHYTKSTDHWIERYALLDFPMVNIEFSFTASDRGMSPIFDRIHCESQEERGKEYRAFMEYSFSLPQFIGSGFFILNDQPLAGRCGSTGNYGECHNFGLIDTTDEPYWDFIKYVKETHENLESIHAKKSLLFMDYKK